MAMTEYPPAQRGRWGLVYEANQDGDPDYPPWELRDRCLDPDGYSIPLADCTEADLRDLAAVAATACGAVVVPATQAALLARMAALLRDCDRMMTPHTSRYAPTVRAIRALLAEYDAGRG